MTLYELEQKLKQLRMRSVDDNTPVIVVYNNESAYKEITNLHISTEPSFRPSGYDTLLSAMPYTKAIEIII